LTDGELAGDGREHSLNLAAQRNQDGDRNDRNERENQRVFDQSLASLISKSTQQDGTDITLVHVIS